MKDQQIEAPTLLDCGHEASPHGELSLGYGTDVNGRRHCYACCAELDKAQMVRDGRTVLYLTDKGVTNWPSSLVFPVRYRRKGRHNMARTRYDVWFTGPDGKNWHGVQYGENTQLCHCRRAKS